MQLQLLVIIVLIINVVILMVFVLIIMGIVIHETHPLGTTKGKGKKRKRAVDLTYALSDVFSNLSKFMNDMNSHISIIASALSTTQQHEQVIMGRTLKLNEQKKGLFNEVIKIPGLTKSEAMMAITKMASNMNYLSLFYQCPDDEWKKDFILVLLYPNLPSSSTG